MTDIVERAKELLKPVEAISGPHGAVGSAVRAVSTSASGRSTAMSDVRKYRIRHRPSIYGSWWLYLPGSENPVGQFRTRERAHFVMDAHRRGADCGLFLRGVCGCEWECSR